MSPTLPLQELGLYFICSLFIHSFCGIIPISFSCFEYSVQLTVIAAGMDLWVSDGEGGTCLKMLWCLSQTCISSPFLPWTLSFCLFPTTLFPYFSFLSCWSCWLLFSCFIYSIDDHSSRQGFHGLWRRCLSQKSSKAVFDWRLLRALPVSNWCLPLSFPWTSYFVLSLLHYFLTLILVFLAMGFMVSHGFLFNCFINFVQLTFIEAGRGF